MTPASINMRDFQYDLPHDRIAQYPLSERDQSKLLVFKDGDIQNTTFVNLSQHLPQHAHIVFNNTKVIPARLLFKKNSGASIEIFLLEPSSPSTLMENIFSVKQSCVWKCTIGNKKKWPLLELLQLSFNDFTLHAQLLDLENNLVQLTWDADLNLGEVLQYLGNIPLPPYMQRPAEDSDSDRYQTVFAEQQGAVAAPTASLHFTDFVLKDLQKHHISTSYLTLHVGAGTFMPVKVENPTEHPMHSEQMLISKDFIEHLLHNHRFVIPAGTTAMRSLESLYWFGVKLQHDPQARFFIEKLYIYSTLPSISVSQSLQNILTYMGIHKLNHISGRTEILIMPGYTFKICKGIITNFHQPGSTLLLLIAALVGEQTWQKIYHFALQNNFRFLSYGDSSLLIPHTS